LGIATTIPVGGIIISAATINKQMALDQMNTTWCGHVDDDLIDSAN